MWRKLGAVLITVLLPSLQPNMETTVSFRGNVFAVTGGGRQDGIHQRWMSENRAILSETAFFLPHTAVKVCISTKQQYENTEVASGKL